MICKTVCRYVLSGMLCATLCNEQASADFMFFHGGHSYLTVTTADTWADAATDAASREFAGVFGELARIDDQAENDAIFAALTANIPGGDFPNTVAPDGGGGAYVWIGATDRATEGDWLWDGDGDGTGDQFWDGDENGSSVGGLYQNWGTTLLGGQNEPDDFQSNQEGGGISLNGWPLGDAGEWNDVAETNALYYLVEFNAVPEPSTAIIALLTIAACLFSRRGRRCD